MIRIFILQLMFTSLALIGMENGLQIDSKIERILKERMVSFTYKAEELGKLFADSNNQEIIKRARSKKYNKWLIKEIMFNQEYDKRYIVRIAALLQTHGAQKFLQKLIEKHPNIKQEAFKEFCLTASEAKPSLSFLSFLIRAGLPINDTFNTHFPCEKYGHVSLLMYCTRNNCAAESVKMLLDAGADSIIADKEKRIALYYAKKHRKLLAAERPPLIWYALLLKAQSKVELLRPKALATLNHDKTLYLSRLPSQIREMVFTFYQYDDDTNYKKIITENQKSFEGVQIV